jgi:hypothetical protein
MVLSKCHVMIGPGYSRLSGDAARAADRGKELGNPNRVGRICQEYNTNRRADRVTWDNWGNQDGYLGRWADWVTRDSWGNQDYDLVQWTNWVTLDSRGNRDGGSG